MSMKQILDNGIDINSYPVKGEALYKAWATFLLEAAPEFRRMRVNELLAFCNAALSKTVGMTLDESFKAEIINGIEVIRKEWLQKWDSNISNFGDYSITVTFVPESGFINVTLGEGLLALKRGEGHRLDQAASGHPLTKSSFEEFLKTYKA